MAAALGDVDLVRRHLDSDPDCIRMSVSEEWFPKQNPRAGGTIYIWTLGHIAPHIPWPAILAMRMCTSCCCSGLPKT